MELDESRKQQLHEIKLQEAAAKANQGLGHKEKVNSAKLKEMGIPAPKINKQKLGIPSQNPMAGTGMFKQGQHQLAQGTPNVRASTDTVPAMLTPGEAVIPAPAAQDPKNKKAIHRMVQQGRKANALRDGAVDVRYSDAPAQAKYHSQGTTMVVPSLAYEHSDVPGSSFNDGTQRVFSRGSADMQHYSMGTYGVVPQQVQSAAGYEDGTEEVSYLDRALNFIAGQEIPTRQMKVASSPLATQPSSDFNSVIERVFQREYPSEEKAYHKVKGDKGGATKYGISQRAYPDLDIKNLTKEQAIEIAKRDYWDKNNIDKLDPSMREIYFDTAFNKGSGTAKKLFERSGGDPNKFLDERQKYVDQLVKNNPSQSKFKQGWSNRVNDLRKVAEAATDVLIPSAQAGTLPVAETASAPDSISRENQNLNARYPALVPVPGFNRMGHMNAIVPTPRSNQSTVEEPSAVNVDPMGNVISVRQDQVIDVPKVKYNSYPVNVDPMGNVIAGNENPLESNVVPQKATTEEVPKPVDMSKNQQAFANDREYNMALSQYAQEVAPEVSKINEESKSIKDPVERKSFLERALSSLFGDSGLFSDKELMRFAIVGAGGMLTGGSVGGSLRFAARDVLQSADRRQAQEAVEAREDKRLKAQDDRLLEGKLIDQGYNIPNIKKFLKTGNQEDLGEAKVIYSPKGVGTTMTAASGLLYGKPITIRQENILTGKQKGGVREIAVVDGKEYDVAALSKLHPLIPYSDAQHGSRAITERFVKTIEASTKTADAVLEQAFGAENVRGKKNPDRQGIPTGREITNQGYSYLRSHGYNADNPDEVQEMNNLFSQATRDMIADKQSNKGKAVLSIEPYLARNIIQHRTGLDSSLFSIGDKPMAPEKIVKLDLTASAYSRNADGKVDQEKKVKLLNEIAKDWKSPDSAKLRERYEGNKDETAFYMFALDELKKLNKKDK
jgi:lysozyme family protein